MHTIRLQQPWDLEEWRVLARAALRAGMPPEAIAWVEGDQYGLDFCAAPQPEPEPESTRRPGPSVPSEFLALADAVLCHRDRLRHGLLYRLLWRIAEGEARLLERATDPDTHRLRELEKSVRRDSHKMKAFVRFRQVPGEPDAFVAWFEPEHYVLDRVAPFFARRFAAMRWAILTPYRSACWDAQTLALGPGGKRSDAPADDAQEALWRTYYAHIFNPARLNPRMMRQEMPQKYWKNLPETHALGSLIRDAGAVVRTMAERAPQAPRRKIPASSARPASPNREDLAEAVRQCRACPLWQLATQAVAGEGPADARIMLVGEQPGDEEDLTGRPFVGPAGRLLDRTLEELGIDRNALYVTNAVKHFRFQRRGKLRMHIKPGTVHVRSCYRWLDAEIDRVRPQMVVCLGATAAQAVLGSASRLNELRGRWLPLGGDRRALVTVHPAAVLRAPASDRDSMLRGFKRDLSLLSAQTESEYAQAPERESGSG